MSGGANQSSALDAELRKGHCIAAPGVYDPYSALCCEQLGFDALYLGGNAMGLHLGVGQPFVTLTETAEIVQRIRRLVSTPLIVDAGAGFGDAAHAALAMRTLSAAGAAAIHVDDQIYPKRAHYHRGKGRLADADVVCGKLRAMQQAGCGRDTTLIIRTDALRVTGSVEQTIARCKQYLEVAKGAALMVLDLGPDKISPFRAAFPSTPLIWIGGIAEPVPNLASLDGAGFALALYPFNTIGAAASAIHTTWSDFNASGRPAPFNKPNNNVLSQTLETIGLHKAISIEETTTEAGE
ncbi:MAG: isocitrate lyase/PEP mutase family protein [Marinosulfonomonas sp.]|nr:isocitrate lyase/PEP mutase family protein [Marinosulfonomonas sp.]